VLWQGERRSAVHPADEKLAALALDIRSRPGDAWEAPAMATRCALSTAQFNRRFKQAFGLSSRQYVLRERIARAADLLRETELSIKEIAEALGYRDVFYFHRQFRQLLGRTPREMRLSVVK
jgi:transcriptional regulator GlxA family with amidase domain